GRGQGTALLRIADGLAASAGKHGMSLIVSDTNVDARRLYERCGYVEVARRWMVKEEWQHPGAAWLLLLKKNTEPSPQVKARSDATSSASGKGLGRRWSPPPTSWAR